MNRHMNLVQRPKQSFQTIGQLVRCGGQCHDRCTDDQKYQTDTHLDGEPDTFFGNFQDPE